MKAYVASHLKDMNRRKVYKVLCDHDVTSKTEIARLTGISAPTVIKVINFLLQKDLVEELGGGEALLGRKPQMLRINKNRYYAVGVIFEGDYLKIGLTNLLNEMIHLKKIRVQDDFDTVMSTTIYNLINELLVESNVKLSDVLGIGIGLPGIYDVEKESINMAPLIGLNEKTNISPVIRNLEERYKLPIIVDNDLNMEVQGEFICEKLSEKDDLIYLSVGTGIGSGVILDGKLRRGQHYMCGEVGYMTFLDDYVGGSSKVGWLESKINISALSKKFDCDNLSELDRDSCETAVEYVSICVALCINNMMMCYDSKNFSIGGEMFNLLGEELFHRILAKVKRLSIIEPNLYLAAGKEPGIIGAASVVANYEMNRLLEE